jgi:hypothetical protein
MENPISCIVLYLLTQLFARTKQNSLITNYIKRHNTQQNDTPYNNIQHNDNQHNDNQHNDNQHTVMNSDTQHIVSICGIRAERRYTECHYAECRGVQKNPYNY